MRSIVVLLTLLSGCSFLSETNLWKTPTPSDRAAAARQEELERAAAYERQRAAFLARYSPPCEAIGFTPFTDAWRNCINQRVMAEEREINEHATRGASGISRSLIYGR